MKNSKNPFYCLVLLVSLTALTPSCTKQLYKKALIDSSQLTEAKRSTSLTMISNENRNLIWKEINGEQYLLMSSWKDKGDYYKNDPKSGFYNTSKYPIWVTAEPDMKQWLKGEKRRFQKGKPLDKRLHQLLGLPPNANKKVFVLFWVRPQDLVRPCADTDVSDNSCDLTIPDGTPLDCENLSWLLAQARASFSGNDLYSRYPFTQLGYTYDWNRKNKRHFGLSEFVIGKNKNVVVEAVLPTADYFAK